MTLLNQLEDMIAAGQVSQVHFGKSALENLTGTKRFCTITRRGEPAYGNTATGKGGTCAEAITDAIGKLGPVAKLPATPAPTEEVVEDLDDLLG